MTAMRLATGVAPAVALLLLLGSMWIETASAEEAENGGVQEVKSPQYAPDDTVDLARRLIVAGNPETAYRLLRRAMQAAADDVDTTAIRYMAAQALLAGGHYAQAAQLLGRFAEDRPDLDLVRLEYAATLFALGRDDKAGEIFRDIRRKKDLPPPVQRNVDGFLERIRARQRWRLDFDMGFWRDDNVNNAPESETVAIPAFGGFRFTLDQKPVRAWIARTGVHLRWREPVTKSGSLYFETHASVSRNTAIGASAYNRTWGERLDRSSRPLHGGNRGPTPARSVLCRPRGGAALARRWGLRDEPVGRARHGAGHRPELARRGFPPGLGHALRRGS